MILKINNLTNFFGKKKVLHNFNLETKPNEILAVVGPSGAGKTTLLRAIAGLEKYRGEIYFDDQLINNISTEKRNIGMVAQDLALFPHLTVFENVAYALKIRKINKQKIKSQVNNLLEKFNIKHLANKLPQNVSGGEAQRTAIARAIIYKPRILLLDEPFAQLDDKLKTDLLKWLRQVLKTENILTLFVTHNMEEAEFISDRIIKVL